MAGVRSTYKLGAWVAPRWRLPGTAGSGGCVGATQRPAAPFRHAIGEAQSAVATMIAAPRAALQGDRVTLRAWSE